MRARISIGLAGFLSAMLLLQFAGISAQGAERGGEATTVRADEIASAAPATSWMPAWFPKAAVLPPPQGEVIRVRTAEELLAAVERVPTGGTILLSDGHYRLPRVLVLRQKQDIALRSVSGDPTRVTLAGQGWDSQAKGDDLLHIARCEGVTIADLSFTDCRSYGIKVEAENGPKDIHIYNCRFRDIGVRAIKGSAGQDPNVRAVKGSVRYCMFENTKIPPADWLFGGDYIAAIDMMALEDWTFSDNAFRNIRGRNGGGRAAIFVWVRSRGVRVERNFILDCDRGVAFGNPGQSTANLAGERPAYVADGIIRNNFIAGGPDSAIELWYADRIKVQHNTIWRPERNWRRGIRIGTGTAHSEVVNNLVHGEILLEGGAAELRTNLTGRLDNYCVDPASGNLALTPAATRAIDQGVPLPDVTDDIRRRSRAQRPDLGAWEYESGDPPAAGAAPATSLGNTSVRYTVPDKPYVVLQHGGLKVVVVDNRAVDDVVLPGHRAGYHGIASLRHVQQPRNLFVPAYAGLNFEHIHDGTVKPREVLFEPRHAPMELRVLNNRAAELYQAPTPHWDLESCMRYELLDDSIIEFTFECVPRRDTFTNGYMGLFWASYIDHPESLDIHFRGFSEGAGAKAGWLWGITPAHGSWATHRAPDDQREFPHDAAFPLELPFGFSRLRYAEPWYFGVCRGMALVQMFRAQDGVRLTQSPSGGGSGCPAWDFQWFINKPRVGQRCQLVMRVAYMPVKGSGEEASVRDQIARLVKERQPNSGGAESDLRAKIGVVNPPLIIPGKDWNQATPVQVPSTIPNDVLPRSRGAGVYGFNWWVNGIKPDGQRLWPGARPQTYYANGLHNNVCIVVPKWRMVIARTNGGRKDGSANTPANVDEIWSRFFSRLAEAIIQ